MKVAQAFSACGPDEIKALLDGGSLVVYSVARPSSPDLPVDRSAPLVTFTFASPAFGEEADGLESPHFAANPAPAVSVGTPGFARALKADGTVVADFSAGAGDREIKFNEVSCSTGAPLKVVQFRLLSDAQWPEKPEFYNTKPRTGFPMPSSF
ncbi:hypothetical protein [Methylocapsa palsarum]|uniref:Uncharacterized protein n=1 Tax=Methylocapsa palsarum TaxID=1612308 RepID=A0A1I3W6V9_9HYPH|nr:hypothetical protein [Methylocapsa palsarum]SFK02186.1 hypothetical protein SAMN05444581_101325 [Methylocapsa palsarum]